MLPKSTTPKSTTAPMAIQSVVCPSSGAGPPCDVPPCDILPCDILPCEGPRDALSCAACSFDGRGEASIPTSMPHGARDVPLGAAEIA